MRLLILTIALGAALALTPAAVPSAAPMTLVGEATADQMAMLHWATGRYAVAGLELPSMEVVFHDDSDACGGNMAIAVTGAVTRVEVCTDAEAPAIVTKRTLLHELAHIWANATLTDADRAAFLELRGLDEWSDAQQWSDRGTEQAAEILMWGLIDQEILLLTIEDREPDGLAAAFELLTGTEPPLDR